MFQVEVLILELLAVDGFPASAIAGGEVSALDHETLDDSMEARTYSARLGRSRHLPVDQQTLVA